MIVIQPHLINMQGGGELIIPVYFVPCCKGNLAIMPLKHIVQLVIKVSHLSFDFRPHPISHAGRLVYLIHNVIGGWYIYSIRLDL